MSNYDRMSDTSQGIWLTLLVGVMLLGLLAGCADFKETNAMIIKSNAERRQAYADAMASCKGDAACQVGVTSSYFSNAGQQQLYRPETAKDYMVAGLPYADIVERVWGGASRGGSNQGGITINGDDNVVSDVGNKTKVDNGSTYSKTMAVSKTEEHIANLGDGQASLDKSQKTELIPEAPAEVPSE